MRSRGIVLRRAAQKSRAALEHSSWRMTAPSPHSLLRAIWTTVPAAAMLLLLLLLVLVSNGSLGGLASVSFDESICPHLDRRPIVSVASRSPRADRSWRSATDVRRARPAALRCHRSRVAARLLDV